MNICSHGRPINNCPLCPVKAPEPPPVGTPVQLNTYTTVSGGKILSQETRLEPVQNADKLPITDPAAKNVMQLAEEYARAQDDLAAVQAAVTNTRSLLRGLEKELILAERKCLGAQQSLHSAVTPAHLKVPRGRPRKTPIVLEILQEKEETSYEKSDEERFSASSKTLG